MTDDPRERLDLLVDTDPLALRDEALRLLDRAEQAEDRRRKAEQAYTQLAERHAETEATRDRWRTRAEEAERRVEHFEEHAAQTNADLGIETKRAEQAETERDQLAARNRALDAQIAEERRGRLAAEAAIRRAHTVLAPAAWPHAMIRAADVRTALTLDQPKDPS
ncbi:hypothetical protein [Actinomadura luteofluorescens]|uniref:hypothetical protein n=1 Tax=Actinomadura luteofluorescens TaxID=46163 RepID=UPI003D8F2ADA